MIAATAALAGVRFTSARAASTLVRRAAAAAFALTGLRSQITLLAFRTVTTAAEAAATTPAPASAAALASIAITAAAALLGSAALAAGGAETGQSRVLCRLRAKKRETILFVEIIRIARRTLRRLKRRARNERDF